MAYVIIEDFSHGLDLRKSAVTAQPGSLRTLRNAFINAGGEVEKRKAFTSVGVLPDGKTVGLAFRNNRLAVFGTVAAGSVGTLPDYTDYYQLIPTTGGLTISRIMDVSPFSTGLYVIARLSDGSLAHFYVNGATANQLTSGGVAGSNARTHSNKQYVVDGRNLRFSAVGLSNDFVGTGSGIIDATAQDTGTTELVGIEQYYSSLALFGRNAVQIWAMDADPTKNQLLQTLGSIGLVAPNAVAKYGSGDCLFLSDTGIRSLRARDASNAAVLNDIGSPIDAKVSDKRATLTPTQAEKITALVDPLSGHFWMVWGTEVLVLSQFPNSKVTAWSVFEPPISVDYATIANSRVAFRSGEELFVYGSVPPSGSPFDPNVPVGSTAALYDAAPVEVELPPVDAGKPATTKMWQGIDVACEGTWTVYINPDPISAQGAWVAVATINGSTYSLDTIPVNMRGTHLGVRLVSQITGPQKLARVTVHYDDGSKDNKN